LRGRENTGEKKKEKGNENKKQSEKLFPKVIFNHSEVCVG